MVFFSVVVTVYNKENYILKTLQSVCKQRFKDFELLVINDGSTDNSLFEISKVTHKNTRVITTKNQGVSAARNTGIENAKGSYIAFLDGDDLWNSSHLEHLKSAIDKYPNESVFSNAAGKICNGKYKPNTYAVNSNTIAAYDYFSASTKTSILHPSSVAIKTNLYKKIGGFNTSYTNYEDVEFWFRIGLIFNIVFTNTVTVRIRDVENSLSKNKFSLEHYYFFEEYDKTNLDNPTFRKVLDMNLCSLALLCKKNGYQKEYIKLKHKIKKHNLNFSNRLLLYSPPPFDTFINWLKTIALKHY